MAKEDKRVLKYLFILFFILLIYLAFLVVSPFLKAILASFVFTYIFYAIYRVIRARLKNKTVSALIASLLIILLLSIPLVFILQTVTEEAGYFYLRAKQKIATGGLLKVSCVGDDGAVCDGITFVNQMIADPDMKQWLEDSLKRFTTFIVEQTSDFVFAIPMIIVHLFVTFFTTFYLFKDGHDLAERFKNLLPINRKNQHAIFKKLHDVAHAVIFGTIIVALIQGALGAIGFWVVGISSPLLWGLLMSIFALIPFVGTGIIWVPAVLFLAVTGYTTGNETMLWQAVGLFFYCFFVVAGIDNIIKPKIIGNRANIHPVIVLLGVLGGIKFFGIVGFVIGPLVLASFVAFLDIYEAEKRDGFRD